MDIEEVQRRADALVTAVTSNEPSTTIIGILEDLQKGVQPTVAVLRSTHIGVIVNKLCSKHRSPDVANLSRKIVSTWRSQVHGQRKAGQRKSVSSKKRTWKADGVDIENTSNDIRDSCIGLLYDGLCYDTIESSDVVLLKAIAVESAAFSLYGSESKPEYRTKIRSLFQNMKHKSNPQLRMRVLSNEVTPDEFVRMSQDQLKSEERREADRKIEQENMNRAMVAQAEHSIITSLQCSKCGQHKVTYTEAQTRSADEPMTVFCTCLNCGKSWKQ
jgi:transcription elongation factor S-II